MKKYLIVYDLEDTSKVFFFKSQNLPQFLSDLLGITLCPWIDFDGVLKDANESPIPSETIRFMQMLGIDELNQSAITFYTVPSDDDCRVI